MTVSYKQLKRTFFLPNKTSIRYNPGLWVHCQTTEIPPSLRQTHLLLGILPLSQLLFRQRYHICLCRPEIAPIPCCHLLCHSVSVHHHYSPGTVETGTSGLSGCSPLFIPFDFTVSAVSTWWLDGHRNTMLVWNNILAKPTSDKTRCKMHTWDDIIGKCHMKLSSIVWSGVD